MTNNKSLGDLGESFICNIYIKNGYQILSKNFRISHFGEIDIIVCNKNVIRFIEVKSRSSDDFGQPLESITRTKILKIQRLAKLFICDNKLENYEVHFDAAAVYFNNSNIFKHEIIYDAF